MKYENFEKAKEIVEKIQSLQKNIDDIEESEYLQFVSLGGFVDYSFVLKKTEIKRTLDDEAFQFRQTCIDCFKDMIKLLKSELESL